MRKTTKMQSIEAEFGRPLEEILRQYIEAGDTWEQIAFILGVSRPTLFTWMCRLGGETTARRSVRFASEEKAGVR